MLRRGGLWWGGGLGGGGLSGGGEYVTIKMPFPQKGRQTHATYPSGEIRAVGRLEASHDAASAGIPPAVGSRAFLTSHHPKPLNFHWGILLEI